MSECLVIPPTVINNTIVALSKDKMCTVFWSEKSKSFESAEGIYTVAEVADATPASENIIKSKGVLFNLANNS
tara:strand:- start:308 stop:526 length:219 start_codon:yes stop_codon:yes gene_type:complete